MEVRLEQESKSPLLINKERFIQDFVLVVTFHLF